MDRRFSIPAPRGRAEWQAGPVGLAGLMPEVSRPKGVLVVLSIEVVVGGGGWWGGSTAL